MRIPAALTLLMALALAACESVIPERNSSFAHIPTDGWAYGDTVSLQMPPAGGRATSLALRHTDSYPYRNLWIEISQRHANGKNALRDTINIEMCDAYGQWHGSGFGDSYQISVRLPEIPDTTELRIRHIMRTDTLREITQIGIISSDK